MIQYQQAYNFINGITPSFVDPKVLFSADELEQIANAFKSGVDTKDVINKNKPIIKAVQQRQRELILDDHLRTIGLNIPDRMDGGFYDELKSYVSGYNLKDHSLSLTIPDNQFAALANNALNKYQGYKEDPTGRIIKIKSTPQQLTNEVTQGTVDKNIGKNMNGYLDSNLAAYMGYGETIPSDYIPDPRQMKPAQQLQQEVITEVTQSPNPKSFNWKNEEWQLVNDPDRGHYWMGSAGSVSPKSYSSEAEAYAAMQRAMNTTRPDNGNVNLNNGLGAESQDPNPGDSKAVDELKRNTWMDKIGSDLKAGGMTSLGIGAGSIALSQMQGNGLVGTGVNLAGALGGSVLGNKYLGEALNPTIGRIGGGLAGHTIANLLMGLFRNPSEKQLLDQGMAYAQQQNGGMS